MRFGLIYADPPWQFRDRMKNTHMGAGSHYQTMCTEDIARLCVQEVCRKDCALALWVPNSLLPDGLLVLDSWGFQYKTVLFVWRKTTKSGGPWYTWGNWTQNCHEICLVGSRGRPAHAKGRIKSELCAPRGRHSAKPHEFYSRLEEMFPGQDKLEMFARNDRPGWTSIGNGIDGKDILESIAELAAR